MVKRLRDLGVKFAALSLVLTMAFGSVLLAGPVQAKAKNSPSVLRYSDRKVHLQKVWKVGPTKEYATFYKLLKEDKTGSTIKFSSRKSYKKTIKYWEKITGDDKVVDRNHYDSSNNVFTVRLGAAHPDNKHQYNRKYAFGEKGYLSVYRDAYHTLKKIGIKNGMNARVAYQKIESYVMKRYYFVQGDFSDYDFKELLSSKVVNSSVYAYLMTVMCSEAGIPCRQCSGSVPAKYSEDYAGDTYADDMSWNRVKLSGKWYYVNTALKDAYGSRYSLSRKLFKHYKLSDVYRFEKNY